MSTSLMPVARQRYFDSNGRPLSGGLVYTFAAGTTTPKATFSDSAGSVPNTNPVVLDVNGEALIYWSGAYRVNVTSATGVQVFGYPVDNYISTDSIISSSSASIFSAFLASSGASLIGWVQAGVGAVYRTVMGKLLENVSALDFGAVNDGLTSSATTNRISIQKAVDYLNSRGGGILKIGGGGVYYVDLTPYFRDNGTEYGVTSIKLRDNVSVQIEDGTTIRLIPNAYGSGAYYRMFSSRDDVRLQNSAIYGGGTIDGNRANQIVNSDDNASNIQLEVLSSVRVQGIRSINAKGMAIQLRGIVGLNASGIIVSDNIIDNVQNIGIQVSSFQNLVISNNVINNCINNAIDIYGEDGSANCQSYGFSIVGNTINTALTGIFCETVRNGVVSGNHVTQCVYGYIVNRINGQPRGISFSGGSALTCQYGARVTGDTGGITFDGMTFSDFSAAGAQLGQGATGSVSYVSVRNCSFIPSSNTVPIIAIGASTASFNSWNDNIVISQGFPESLLVSNIALSSTGNIDGSFTVLPNQVGKREVNEISGSFLPTLYGATTAGTQTYSDRTGRYSKIGKVVNFTASIVLSAKDAATAGALMIDGLPYPCDSARAYGLSVAQANFVTLSAGYTQFAAGVSAGTNKIALTQMGNNVGSIAVQASGFAANSAFIITGSYLTTN